MRIPVRSVLAAIVVLSGLGGCKDQQPPGAGLVVVDASTTSAPDAATVDISTCAGCQLSPIPAWTFEGVYSDAKCSEPLAQITVPACTVVPALGATSLTYVDADGLRKANETATVTLLAQIAAEAPRYRKASDGKTCVRANEGATDITPTSCAAQRACRDEGGGLTCTTCRKLASGCPDYEATRLYASLDDPGIKGKPAAGGGGNAARLGQCCAALAAQARALGASPEGGMLLAAAAQCQTLVAQAGPTGNAPELGALRAALAGRNLPAVCAGF